MENEDRTPRRDAPLRVLHPEIRRASHASRKWPNIPMFGRAERKSRIRINHVNGDESRGTGRTAVRPYE